MTIPSAEIAKDVMEERLPAVPGAEAEILLQATPPFRETTKLPSLAVARIVLLAAIQGLFKTIEFVALVNFCPNNVHDVAPATARVV